MKPLYDFPSMHGGKDIKQSKEDRSKAKALALRRKKEPLKLKAPKGQYKAGTIYSLEK